MATLYSLQKVTKIWKYYSRQGHSTYTERDASELTLFLEDFYFSTAEYLIKENGKYLSVYIYTTITITYP